MDGQILFVLGSRTCVPEDPLIAARDLGMRSVVFTPRQPGCGTATELMDRVYQVSVQRPELAVQLARELHRRSPILGVIGYEEDATLLAAHLAEDLGLPAHPVSAAEAAMDKPTMKQRFVDAGVPCADFVVADDEDDAVSWAESTGFPVVVKPCRGGASQGVIRADDSGSLRAAYRRLRRIIKDYHLDNGDRPGPAQLVESYLPGDEVSVELLLQHGTAEVITEFGKPLPLTGPFFEETVYVTPPTLDPVVRKEVHELAVAAARALGFHHGPAHCEIRLTPEGPRVLEIAGRVLGGACARSFRDRLGGDVHTYLLRAAAGERVTIPAPPDDAPVVGALMMPVPGEGRVFAVDGVDRARRVPGVWDVTMMACPGDVLVPFPEQSCYAVGFVSASGPDEASVIDSLSWAGSSISVELEPVAAERWARSLPADDLDLPTGCDVAEPDEDGTVAELAEILFDELPTAEAQRGAREVLHEHLDRPGTHRRFRVGDLGMVLVTLDDRAGHLGRGGCLPAARTPENGTRLLRAAIAELTRRGAGRVTTDVDPRRPHDVAAVSELGLRPETTGPSPRGQRWVVTCGLTPVPAGSCSGGEAGGDAAECCTC